MSTPLFDTLDMVVTVMWEGLYVLNIHFSPKSNESYFPLPEHRDIQAICDRIEQIVKLASPTLYQESIDDSRPVQYAANLVAARINRDDSYYLYNVSIEVG